MARARRDGHAAVVVGLGDQPLVQTEAWRRVARAATSPLAVATYEGERGNPVRLSSMAWPLLPAAGDEGARVVMRRRPDLVVEVPCPGRAADIDTVDDLATWTDPGGSHGADERLPGGRAGRAGVGRAHRRRADRPVHARRPAQEVEGDEYRGIVKIKVGPITAQYKGTATFVERDDERAQGGAAGRGPRHPGQGNANATITATLTPDGDGTAVTVATDLTVTGRVAQFGRGVMADVSAKLLGQFVDCLENKLLVDVADPGDLPSAAEVKAREASWHQLRPGEPAHGPLDLASEGGGGRAVDLAADEVDGVARRVADPPPGGRLDGTSGPAVGVVDSPEPEPVDLLEAAGAPVAKRARSGRRGADGPVAAEPLPAPPAPSPQLLTLARLGARDARARVFPLARPAGQPRRSGGIGRRARLRA